MAGLNETEHNDYWFEAPWEGVNDSLDEQITKIMEDFARRSNLPKYKDYAEQRLGNFCYCCACIAHLAMQVFLTTILPKTTDLLLDLPLYLGEPRGERIRKKVREGVEAHPGCVLVGHSLGSLICYDLIREIGQEGAVKALVTLGTPIEWVTRIRQAEDSKGFEEPLGVGIPWHNFYHPSDPVCLHRGLDERVFQGVVNRKIGVSTGSNKLREGFAAHTSYWKDLDVADVIKQLGGFEEMATGQSV